MHLSCCSLVVYMTVLLSIVLDSNQLVKILVSATKVERKRRTIQNGRDNEMNVMNENTPQQQQQFFRTNDNNDVNRQRRRRTATTIMGHDNDSNNNQNSRYLQEEEAMSMSMSMMVMMESDETVHRFLLADYDQEDYESSFRALQMMSSMSMSMMADSDTSVRRFLMENDQEFEKESIRALQLISSMSMSMRMLESTSSSTVRRGRGGRRRNRSMLEIEIEDFLMIRDLQMISISMSMEERGADDSYATLRYPVNTPATDPSQQEVTPVEVVGDTTVSSDTDLASNTTMDVEEPTTALVIPSKPEITSTDSSDTEEQEVAILSEASTAFWSMTMLVLLAVPTFLF